MSPTISDPVLQARVLFSDRDLILLEWLYDHQALTIEQIAAALFTSRRSAEKRLLELHRHGILDRFQIPAEGRRTMYYVLARLGTAIAAAQRGDPAPRAVDVTERQRRIAMSPQLSHLTGVNQFFIDIIARTRRTPGTALVRWWSERRCAEPLRFGAVSMHRVRADAHGIYAEGNRRVAFFLEYDRGTESIPVLIGKFRRYEQLVAHGGPNWPLLFVLPRAGREQQLLGELRRRRTAVPVATVNLEALGAGMDVTDAVWLTISFAARRQRLIELEAVSDPADESTLSLLDRRPAP